MLCLEAADHQVRKTAAAFLSEAKRKTPIIVKANCLEITLRAHDCRLHLALEVVTDD